jgi:hypothetical protein
MANRKKKETKELPELPKLPLEPTPVVELKAAKPVPAILNRNGIFQQLGPRKRNVYPSKLNDSVTGWSRFIKSCNDLAISNNLDIQYKVVRPSGRVLSIGTVSDDFLRDLASIVGSYEFSCILYDPNKDLVAIYQWPDLDVDTFKIKDWVNFESKRIVWILGLWS